MPMKLTGYADRFSVRPGEKIRFHVSADVKDKYDAQLVHLIHGNTDPRGPGMIEKKIEAPINGSYEGHKQVIYAGSYGIVEDHPQFHMESLTLQCWIWPTMPTTDKRYWKHGAQAIMSKWHAGKGYGLFLDVDGHVEFRINGKSVRSKYPVRDHAWVFVAATYDAESGTATLYCEPQIHYALDPTGDVVEGVLGEKLATPSTPFILAGCVEELDDSRRAKASRPEGVVIGSQYNGKIDSPRLCNRALSRLEIETMKAGADTSGDERRGAGPTPALSECMVAAWDFSAGIDTMVAHDAGPYHFNAELINAPTRALTGHNWTGHVFDWKQAPGQYGAIHFHDDDLDDARWQVDFEWDVPADQKSATYAIKLTAEDGAEDYIPFFVTPWPGKPTAKIAVCMSTISYLAYANEHLATNAGGAELLVYRVPIMQEQNMYLSEHREYGGSQYDTHTDGSGICFSTRLRPILSMRPKYDHFLAQSPWQFSGDLHLIYWLEKMGYEYDVITDEDMTYDGLRLLEGYNVVMTGMQPEHIDGHQLDALQNYKQRGGRFMYMGADGFYWVHSFHPSYDDRGRGILTEFRRCESGIRTWRADPGEYYHQSTGELGGMWRFRGRYLHAIAGTGMSSEGFDISTYYTRTKESLDPRVAWAFEGIEYDEKLGNFGLNGGGAAGLELDIVDTMLGSPPHTLTVATSAGRHTEAYLLVMEDYGFSQAGIDGTQHPRVRSDIAFHETPNGGAVFAFSSIAFCGALPWNNGDNNISKLVGNVLNRFMQDGPLPPPPESEIRPRGRAEYVQDVPMVEPSRSQPHRREDQA